MPAQSLPEIALPNATDFGLTMRDYFAAAALNALLSTPRAETKDEIIPPMLMPKQHATTRGRRDH